MGGRPKTDIWLIGQKFAAAIIAVIVDDQKVIDPKSR
jgi:hypothetical protein